MFIWPMNMQPTHGSSFIFYFIYFILLHFLIALEKHLWTLLLAIYFNFQIKLSFVSAKHPSIGWLSRL